MVAQERSNSEGGAGAVAELRRPAVWRGAPADYVRLEEAVRANCEARETLDSEGRTDRCGDCRVCAMLLDQIALDRFCFLPAAAFVAAEHARPAGRAH